MTFEGIAKLPVRSIFGRSCRDLIFDANPYAPKSRGIASNTKDRRNRPKAIDGSFAIPSFLKKMLFLIAGVCTVYGVEIPEEEGLICSELSNGIHLWMKPTTEGAFYCRIVSTHPGYSAPQIFPLDDCTRDEFFEEEMPVFVPNMLQRIPNLRQCRIGVVVVGQFDKTEMEQYLTEALESYASRQESPQIPPFIIGVSEEPNQISTALTYAFPFQQVRTVEDLKQMWTLGLLRSIFETQMQSALLFDKKGAHWSYQNTSYALPFLYATARGEMDFDGDPIYLLSRFMSALQELKATGFTSDDLAEAKDKLNSKLQLFYQKDPTNRHLADYYAFHLALGDRCPSYPIFMPMSLQAIQEIDKPDFENVLMESFRTDQCQIEIKVPAAINITPAVIQKIVSQFEIPRSDIEWKKEKVHLPLEAKAKEIFESLPMTHAQAMMIREIIETVADKNIVQLGWIRSEMEKKGKSVESVHPMRFLGVVFSDPHLKKCMKICNESSFKWDGFLNGSGGTRGFWAKMENEHKRNNLIPHVEGFCLAVKANPEEVESIIKNKGWDKLVLYLIYKD